MDAYNKITEIMEYIDSLMMEADKQMEKETSDDDMYWMGRIDAYRTILRACDLSRR